MTNNGKSKYLTLTICVSVSALLLLGACCKECPDISSTVSVSHNTPLVPLDGRIKNQDDSCYYDTKAPDARILPLSKRNGREGGVGAVFIDFDPVTKAPISYYPTVAFQKKLSKARSRQELSKLVKKAVKLTDFGPHSLVGSPFDFYANTKSTTVFRLLPEAWYFHDNGFYIETNVAGKYSPFSPAPEIDQSQKLVLVDFDRLGSTPQGKKEQGQIRNEGCHYKYNLDAIAKSPGGKETKIKIDPIIGNNGGPPGQP